MSKALNFNATSFWFLLQFGVFFIIVAFLVQACSNSNTEQTENVTTVDSTELSPGTIDFPG